MIPKGVPLPPLCIRGAGLQGRFPSRLRVGVLVGYNCVSCYTRKVGSYPYTAGSFLQSCATSSPDEDRLDLVGPTYPIRVSVFGPPRGYPGVTSPTVAPECFTVEPQHVFVEVLSQVDAERLGFVPLFV